MSCVILVPLQTLKSTRIYNSCGGGLFCFLVLMDTLVGPAGLWSFKKSLEIN